MKVKFTKTIEYAHEPDYATPGSACMDLHACLPHGPVHVVEGLPAVIDTGIAVAVPENHAMLVFSRSGHGFNLGIRLANCVGVIDSDYRGSIKVKLTSDLNNALKVNDGDRIAQALIVAAPSIELMECDTLDYTERGHGGFGSTGA